MKWCFAERKEWNALRSRLKLKTEWRSRGIRDHKSCGSLHVTAIPNAAATLNLNKAAFVPEAFNKTAIESIQEDVQLLWVKFRATKEEAFDKMLDSKCVWRHMTKWCTETRLTALMFILSCFQSNNLKMWLKLAKLRVECRKSALCLCLCLNRKFLFVIKFSRRLDHAPRNFKSSS